MKINNSNLVAVSLSEKLSVLFFLILISGFYFYFDPSIMLQFEIFPWDSLYYRSLAENLHSSEGMIYERSPFSYRILFPWLYGYIQNITGIPYVFSSFVVGLFSSWAVLVLSYILWRKSNCSRTTSWAGLIYFSVLWIGPIRYSIFYPGGSFAFDILLIFLFFLIVTKIQKGNLFFLLISMIGIFLLALGREIITYMTLFVTIIHVFTKSIDYKSILKSRALLKLCSELESRNTLRMVLISISSILGYLYVRTLVHGQGNEGITLDNIITFGWLHLHVAEFIYPFFYALGTVALILFSMSMLTNMRTRLYIEFSKYIENIDILILILICAVVFSMLGGTDSDRYLLWFFPFFSLLALKGLEIILTLEKRKSILVLLFFSALFSSRFYVPSTPHFFFPGNAYSSQANIKTNYDPDLYYGLPFMERFRLPLKKIPSSDSIADGIKSESADKIDFSPQIPVSISKESLGNLKHWYRKHYKYEINNIPFPLGFSHNQYELLAAHPSYGGIRIKIALLLQWLIIFVLLVFLLNKSKDNA